MTIGGRIKGALSMAQANSDELCCPNQISFVYNTMTTRRTISRKTNLFDQISLCPVIVLYGHPPTQSFNHHRIGFRRLCCDSVQNHHHPLGRNCLTKRQERAFVFDLTYQKVNDFKLTCQNFNLGFLKIFSDRQFLLDNLF